MSLKGNQNTYKYGRMQLGVLKLTKIQRNMGDCNYELKVKRQLKYKEIWEIATMTLKDN